MPLAMGMAFLRRLAGLFLDPVQLPDQGKTSMRLSTSLTSALRLDRVTELASGMRHATEAGDATRLHGGVVAVIAIRL